METQKPNYKRLYGDFVRSVLAKMTALKDKGMDMEESDYVYSLEKVFFYFYNNEERNKGLQDPDNKEAAQAQVFLDWLSKNGHKLPEVEVVEKEEV